MDEEKENISKMIRAYAKTKVITNQFSMEDLAKMLNMKRVTLDQQIRKELK